MMNARRAAGSLLVVLLSATVSSAGTFSDDLSSTTTANIINLFLNPSNNTTFSLTAPIIQVSGGATWTYTVSPNGKSAQFLTHSPVSGPGGLTANFDWIQFLEQPTAAGGFAGTPYSIDVQQVQFNWTTGTIIGGVNRHVFRFGDVPPGGFPQYGNAGGSFAFVGPVPEPSTVLVIALGGLVLGIRARRRK
jgi:hypothetical protein